MKWKVYAFQGKEAKRKCIARTWVEADSEDLAKQIGRTVMAVGITGRFAVSAARYYPERDPEFRCGGYIREVANAD